MINFKLVYKVIGSLLFIEAIMMLSCLLVSVYYREDDILAFLATIAVTVLAAIGLKFKGYHAENSMGRREAYLLVTLIWVIFSAIGALPFVISGYLTSYTDAFLETMSGFTTTGATIIDDVEALPHGLLFWRSLTHWIGGLGIMFFTIAILPSLVGGSVKVFSAEATGPIKSRMHPRLSTTAKWIWAIYIILTAGCAACFCLFGMGIFDSINYSISITATGGFATHNASIAFFDSAAIDYTAAIFMILSGINFSLLYILMFKGKVKDFVKDSELRFYLTVISLSTLFITFLLTSQSGIRIADAFRYADRTFQHRRRTLAPPYMGRADDMHGVRVVRGKHQRRYKVRPRRHAPQDNTQRVQAHTAPEGRHSAEAQRHQHTPPGTGHAPGVPLAVRHNLPRGLLLLQAYGRRDDQRHNDSHKQRKQRRAGTWRGHRAYHVVEHPSRRRKMDMLGADALGTSRISQRNGTLHTRVLEGKLTLPIQD